MSESLRDLLERSAEQIDTHPSPEFLGTRFENGRSARMRRHAAWGLAAVAVITAAAVVAHPRPGPEHASDPAASTPDHGRLTDEEFALATRLAHQEGAGHGNTVTGALAIVRSRGVTGLGPGHPCATGHILTVDVYGNFPHAHLFGNVLSSPVGNSVSGLRLEANSDTGKTCPARGGVITAGVTVDPDATLLYGSRPSTFVTGMRPATQADLLGTWTPVDSDGTPLSNTEWTQAPSLVLIASGEVAASRGCDFGTATWSVPEVGHLNITPYLSNLMRCDRWPAPHGDQLRADVSGDSLIISSDKSSEEQYFTRRTS